MNQDTKLNFITPNKRLFPIPLEKISIKKNISENENKFVSDRMRNINFYINDIEKIENSRISSGEKIRYKSDQLLSIYNSIKGENDRKLRSNAKKDIIISVILDILKSYKDKDEDTDVKTLISDKVNNSDEYNNPDEIKDEYENYFDEY